MLPGRRRAPGISKGCSRPADYRIYQPVVGSERRHFRQDNATHLVAIERQHNAEQAGRGPDQRAVSCDGRWARSGEPDVQAEVPEPQVKYSAAGLVHDERQQDDGQDDHDHPEEEHDDAGDGIPGYSSRSSHGHQLPTAVRLIRRVFTGDDDAISWPFRGRHHVRAAGRRGRSGSGAGPRRLSGCGCCRRQVDHRCAVACAPARSCAPLLAGADLTWSALGQWRHPGPASHRRISSGPAWVRLFGHSVKAEPRADR